eukprot:CAMPEP_0118694100 /NCGR_PEP_ID=MMETSP0800-20121206/12299_1 /TAXON_ID=210618 ORGANISM="Striatella unipunctata, Strain CCMP2910" /NCGR_SAMPLE_ID=MMETSP0800 /ASSEMBLY_ACC=CAM_ASM_000638 /LENGTH=150 /DNA_ID=CAMNT_0006592455 /DNA_START=171 /DNA_END=623 /DNA_ORIENTATION=+
MSSKLRSKFVKEHSSRPFRSCKDLSETKDRDVLVDSLSPLLDPMFNEDNQQEVIFDELLQPFRPRLARSRSAPNPRRFKTIEPAPDTLREASRPVLKKKKSFTTEEALKLAEKRRELSSRPNLLGFRHYCDSDKFPKGIIPVSTMPSRRF